MRASSFFKSSCLILLLALAIAGFWWLEPATPERIASLTFLFLVGGYALYTRRYDILAASTIFFAVVDINRYFFDVVLPIWISMGLIIILLFMVWALLFGRMKWLLAIAASLVVLELMLAMQYVNVEPKLQALIIATPFILVSQFCYFQED